MGGKKKSTPPPTITLPGPSKTETAMQAQQLELMKKQMTMMDELSSQRNQDRTDLTAAMQQLTNGRDLTDQEKTSISQMSDQYKNMVMSGITDGMVKEQLDRGRSSSIANLIERGVLNSTTGSRVLSDIENERSRLISQASTDSAMQRLQLEQNFRNNATNIDLARSQLLSGSTANLQNMVSGLSGQAAGGAAQLYGQANAERMAQSQIAGQNAQAQWMYQNKQAQQAGGSGAKWGSIIGAGLGALAAPFTGGLSLAGGLALGSTLGGAAGSAF